MQKTFFFSLAFLLIPLLCVLLSFTPSVFAAPVPDVKANGSDGPITITTSDILSITVSLDSGGYAGQNADWWVLVQSPVGWYHYDVSSGSWKSGQTVTYQGPLFDLSTYEVLNKSGLPAGSYTFYFGIDMNMNGKIDYAQLYYDSVVVTVQPSPPTAPSNLIATAISSSQIDLSWTDNSNNEIGFKIERKRGVEGTYSQIATVGANVTTYSDTGLTSGTTYYYRVRAYNSGGDSVYSNEASATTMIPPTAITNPATNVNGNSVTLNATVNPNGAGTTVYFEWGISISYGNTTTSQSIGSGTSDVTVSANITGLSPSTTYHYRVVATNTGGTSYGSDMSFTTPPITLTITSPSDGSTIYRPNVMIKGTVTNSTGNETGVTVNGIVAATYNSQFFVNHVPLEEGSNTITATATDTDGNTATTSITVNAVTTTPYVTLTANIESGIAPLETYFSVSTSIPNAVSTYQMDYEGDGTIDYSGATFDDINATYTVEGIYYPTVVVTDSQGIQYTDTIAIVVLNAADLDALLRAKWNAMKTALANQDVNTALSYFTEESKQHYNELFTALQPYLPQIVQEMQEIELIHLKSNSARYRIRRDDLYGGQMETFTYYIYFMVDDNGIWKIDWY